MVKKHGKQSLYFAELIGGLVVTRVVTLVVPLNSFDLLLFILVTRIK